MRILITGGAGFIGSALVRYLVEEIQAQVLVFDKLTYAGNLENLASIASSPNYEFVHGDICEIKLVRDTLATFQPNHIMHLAAESHVDRSITGAKTFIDTNINGTFTLLEAAREYYFTLNHDLKAKFRFLHVSTDEVYGTLGDEGMFEENTPYDPSSPYSASKAASDHLAKAWFRTYGLPVIISNCSNNYGPYHFPEKLIPLNIINALENKPITIYGKGHNIRDWLYVHDHARALHLICRKGKLGETYNVGGRNERSNIQVIEKICEIMDELLPQNSPHSRLITFVADRPGHDARYAIDASKLENDLGWRALENFDTGIKKTVKWYIENREWWQVLRNKIYSGQRIGLIKNQSGK